MRIRQRGGHATGRRNGDIFGGPVNPLTILYRDSHIVAVHKPAGLHVHPTPESPGEPSCLKRLRRQLDRWVYPVHRLDRATAGVLLFALTPEAAADLARQFREHEADKAYLAVVRGFLPAAGRIDHPLGTRSGAPPLTARTEYTCLATLEVPRPVGRFPSARFSMAEARPRTGRRHQLRRHFHHISHPILGDTTHGDGVQNRFVRAEFGLPGLLLLAWRIAFSHPATGEPMAVATAPPPAWAPLLEAFGWPGEPSRP
jgi:tRNA pseudouridine65 synthase